jgi:RNA polymerase sigma-70 factor (ECF subfamily)
VPRVARAADLDAAMMKGLYDEHAAVLWRYVLRLTGDASRAEDVVQETLLQWWQHPGVIGDTERSARAWLFTVARNMIIDGRGSARFVNATLDRLLIADAMAQLSAEHQAVIDRSYYRGWTTAQIAADLGIAEGTVKSRLHYAVRALRFTMPEAGVTR